MSPSRLQSRSYQPSAEPSRCPRIGPIGSADAQDLLVGDGGQQVDDRHLHTQVGAVAPGEQPGIQLRNRLEREAALMEARVRNDQAVLGIGDASAVEAEDVEVDDPGAPSASLGVAAERQLQALQLGEQVER